MRLLNRIIGRDCQKRRPVEEMDDEARSLLGSGEEQSNQDDHVSHNSTREPDGSGAEDDSPGERSPLIPGNNGEDELVLEEGISKRKHRRYEIILILLLAAIGLFFIARITADSVIDALDLNIKELSLQRFTELGIEFNIIGESVIHYDNITNPIARYPLKFLGYLLGYLTLEYSTILIYVGVGGKKRQTVAHVVPPTLRIDIGNKKVTKLDFSSDIVFDKVRFKNLIEQLNALKKDETPIKVEARLRTSLRSRWMKYVPASVSIRDEFIWKSWDEVVTKNITISDINMTDNSFNVEALLLVDYPLPITFELPSFDWHMYLESCNGSYTQIGSCQTAKLNRKIGEPLLVNVTATVLPLPEDILQECSDGISLINQLVNNFFVGAPIGFILTNYCKSYGKKFPEWASYFLSHFDFHFQIIPPSIENTLDFSKLGSLTSPYYEMDSSVKDGSKLSVTSNLNWSSIITSKFSGIEIGASDIEATLSFFGDDKKLFKSYISSGSDAQLLTNRHGNGTLEILVEDVETSIVNASLLGQAIDSLINDYGDDHLTYSLDIDVSEVRLDTPIMKTVLKGIRLQTFSISSIEGHKYSDDISHLLEQLNLTVTKMKYISSGANELEIQITSLATNPTNVTFELPKSSIFLDLDFNGTRIGLIEVRHPSIEGQKDLTELRTVLKLNTNDNHVKTRLEDFMGQLISGVQNLTVSVEGKELELDRSSDLSKLLSQVSVRDVVIPQIEFEGSRSYQVLQQHSSPFFIEATIHILTSEVEATIFNPFDNVDIEILLYQAEAVYEGNVLGHLSKPQKLIVPPGLYKTPKVPVTINPGVGADILRKALNGKLLVNVYAAFNAKIGKFTLQLLYVGRGTSANVRL